VVVADEGENKDGDGTGVAGEGGGSDPGTGTGSEAGAEVKGSASDGGGDGGAAHPDQGGVSSVAIARAIRSGLRVDEALALGSDDRVNEVASGMESERLASQEAEVAEEAENYERERIAEERKQLSEDFPTLDPDETDPKVIDAFDRMRARFEKQQAQLDAFEEAQREYGEAAFRVNASEITNWFNGQLEALNKTFVDTLGKDGLPAITLESQKGDQVAAKMAALIGSYASQGLKTPSREEVFADAARLVLREEFAQSDEARLAEKVSKRAGMEMERPGGSKGKTEKSPEDETADELNKRFFKTR